MGLGCSRRTVNQPGFGTNETTRTVPPAESRTIVAASPARYENWVVDPGTAAGLTVTGADAGVELAVEPDPGVVCGVVDEDEEDADAGSGALPSTWP